MIRHDIDIGFCKSPGCLNTVGSKIEIKLSFRTSDKGLCVLIGDHNGSVFMSCIFFMRNGVHSQVNIVGGLSIASATHVESDDTMVLRCNTNKYGTCVALATIPIEYVIFSN